jgi:hypothetical protein
VGRAVQKGQTQNVNVLVSYTDKTLDNLHRYKYNGKTLIVLKLLSDKKKDLMYENDYKTKTRIFEGNLQTLKIFWSAN